MITDSYDIQTEAVATAEDYCGLRGHLCDVCIVTYSFKIMDHILRRFPCEKCAEIRACNGATPVYSFVFHSKRFCVYLSHVGSSGAANDVIEVSWMTGATRFVMFGSAGSLNREATTGRYVIPTAAYRDEGMSYHYAPPADYIDMPGAARVAAIFDEMHVPYVLGKIWTTDAFYRETRGQMAKRVSEGCIAVEMEVAGVQAVCDFHGLELYDFLVTGDALDQPEYDPSGLHDANHSLDKLDLALEIAVRI